MRKIAFILASLLLLSTLGCTQLDSIIKEGQGAIDSAKEGSKDVIEDIPECSEKIGCQPNFVCNAGKCEEKNEVNATILDIRDDGSRYYISIVNTSDKQSISLTKIFKDNQEKIPCGFVTSDYKVQAGEEVEYVLCDRMLIEAEKTHKFSFYFASEEGKSFILSKTYKDL